MNILYDIATCIRPMIQAWDVAPNLLAVLVIYAGTYAIMFSVTAIICTFAAWSTDRHDW